MQINLTEKSAAVLIRCLAYGESAISREEVENGTADHILEQIDLLRKSVCHAITQPAIESMVCSSK